MKLLLMSDLHIRQTNPRCRKDNFWQTQLSKFSQAVDIAVKEGCSFILQAGDFFDNPRQPLSVLFHYIPLLKKVPVLTVYGQHDLYMRSYEAVDKTAMALLDQAGIIRCLGEDPFLVDDVAFYGGSYGRPVPSPYTTEERNILVLHAPVGTKQLFPDHKLVSPEEAAYDYLGYDLILCGDYHYPFQVFTGDPGTWVVNMGALVRLTISAIDRALMPSVGVYDTRIDYEHGITVHKLDVVPSEVVFDLSTLEDEDKTTVEMFGLFDALKRDGRVGVDFVQNLRLAMDKSTLCPDARKELESVIEETKDE